MHHVRQPQVLHEGRAADDFGRQIEARQVFADQPALGGRNQLGLRRRPHMQQRIADQFAVAEAAAVIGDDRAVFCGEAGGRHLQQRRGPADQQRTRLRRGIHDRGAAVLHRMAAGGVAFVRGQRRIGRDEADHARRDDQFLGRQLDEGGLQSLAQFGLAGEDGDVAAAADPDPGIEHRIFGKIARQSGPSRRRRSGVLCRDWPAERKADDKGTAASEQGAPRQARGIHRLASSFGPGCAFAQASASRRIARMMRK